MRIDKKQIKGVLGLTKVNRKRPWLNVIVHSDGYAYYTNRFVVVRWKLDKGFGKPEGSFINLSDASGEGSSLSLWSRNAKASDSIALETDSLWKTSEGLPQFLTRLSGQFTDTRKTVDGESASVMMDFSFVSDLGLILNDREGRQVIGFSPLESKNGRPLPDAVRLVRGNKPDVEAVISPMKDEDWMWSRSE